LVHAVAIVGEARTHLDVLAPNLGEGVARVTSLAAPTPESDTTSRNAARPPPGRLLLAEAQHEAAATWPNGPSEALDERRTIVIIEDVEEAAVKDDVEVLAERVQPTSVPHHEACSYSSLLGLGFREADGR
jgi:hypothetical protein